MRAGFHSVAAEQESDNFVSLKMEDDKKKKKKNKKKKNKQAEATDSAPVSGNGQAFQAAAAEGRSDDVQVQASEAVADIRSDAKQDGDANGSNGFRHENNGTQCALLAESEKQNWLQREASLEETIKQLQMEKDLHIQNEATLEDIVKRLRNENESRMQKEAALEVSIKQLRHESDSLIQKEADQQKEIVQLQSEKDAWLQKEVGLEEKIGRLVDEKGSLDSKETSLQEKIKHLERDRDTWIQKEDYFKEMIATLSDDIARLRAQVLELEQSRNNLVQENQQLMESSSSLQLQIKNLESVSSTPSSDELAKHASEREDLNSQVEAAFALVEKLMTENAELVEKVSELYVQLDRRSETAELTSTKAPNITVAPPESASVIDPMSRSNGDMIASDQKFDAPEVVPIKQEMHSNGNVDTSTSDKKLDSPEAVPNKQEMHNSGSVDSQHVDFVPDLPVSDDNSEIVQIPLDENEVRNLELLVETDKNAAVPLIDAPLIGAPFRLMSFVARYVSGADLVNKDPTNPSN